MGRRWRSAAGTSQASPAQHTTPDCRGPQTELQVAAHVCGVALSPPDYGACVWSHTTQRPNHTAQLWRHAGPDTTASTRVQGLNQGQGRPSMPRPCVPTCMADSTRMLRGAVMIRLRTAKVSRYSRSSLLALRMSWKWTCSSRHLQQQAPTHSHHRQQSQARLTEAEAAARPCATPGLCSGPSPPASWSFQAVSEPEAHRCSAGFVP